MTAKHKEFSEETFELCKKVWLNKIANPIGCIEPRSLVNISNEPFCVFPELTGNLIIKKNDR